MKNLVKLRKSKNLTQEELGEIVGVKKAAISKYEKNQVQPSKDILFKLSEYFDCSIDFLLDKTLNPVPPNKQNEFIEYFRHKSLEEQIIESSEISEESKKDMVKQLRMLKLLENARANNEFCEKTNIGLSYSH